MDVVCGKGVSVCGRGYGVCGEGVSVCGRGYGVCGEGVQERVWGVDVVCVVMNYC